MCIPRRPLRRSRRLMLHGFSASKISQTIRAPSTRHRATRNRNTGENLRHRADAACRCVTKRAGACRTREISQSPSTWLTNGNNFKAIAHKGEDKSWKWGWWRDREEGGLDDLVTRAVCALVRSAITMLSLQ